MVVVISINGGGDLTSMVVVISHKWWRQSHINDGGDLTSMVVLISHQWWC